MKRAQCIRAGKYQRKAISTQGDISARKCQRKELSKPAREMKHEFSGELKVLIDKAVNGNPHDIDYIMDNLTVYSTLAMTRYVDFALSLVENESGIEHIEYYLFNGTLIQRNYASLFLNRLGIWKPVKQAFEQGLIDEIQAYSR